MKNVINFIIFQVGWFACVYGGANQLPWLGTIFVAVALLLHLKMVEQPAQEIRLIATALTIGLGLELFLINAAIVVYPSGILITGIPPHWILALWVLFAMTLNMSLGWLKNHLYISAILGAVAGPLSYLAGFKLGGVTFPNTTLAMIILGCNWALITPCLVIFASRFDSMPKLSGAEMTSEYLQEAPQNV
jgi:hypothetical protein